MGKVPKHVRLEAKAGTSIFHHSNQFCFACNHTQNNQCRMVGSAKTACTGARVWASP